MFYSATQLTNCNFHEPLFSTILSNLTFHSFIYCVWTLVGSLFYNYFFLIFLLFFNFVTDSFFFLILFCPFCSNVLGVFLPCYVPHVNFFTLQILYIIIYCNFNTLRSCCLFTSGFGCYFNSRVCSIFPSTKQ